MGTELIVSKEALKASEALAVIMGGYNPLADVMRQAAIIRGVREWIDIPEIREVIGSLMNSPMGFMTDKKGNDRYSLSEVAIVISQGLMVNAKPTHNEINIIAGNLFLTKNYYNRQLDEFQNDAIKVVGKNIEMDEFVVNGNTVSTNATVRYTIKALKEIPDLAVGKTKEMEFKRRISLRTKSNDTPDAWEGKVERRILKKLYSYLSGVDIDSDDFIMYLDPRLEVTPKPTPGKIKLSDKLKPEAEILPEEEESSPEAVQVSQVEEETEAEVLAEAGLKLRREEALAAAKQKITDRKITHNFADQTKEQTSILKPDVKKPGKEPLF